MGTAVSGKLIVLSPVGGNGQLHNYGLIFAISSFGSFLAFLWALFAINQQKDTKQFEEHFGENPKLEEQLEVKETNSQQKNINPIKLLFDLKNVKEMVMTCIKKRKSYVRVQIWLIILSIFCHQFVIHSPGSFLFQFVEKIYEWDAQTYSYISSVGNIIQTAVMMTITPVFIKVIIIFPFNDSRHNYKIH